MNYKMVSKKIKRAKSHADLDTVERTSGRLYDAGLLTVGEFARLDDMIFVRRARADSNGK